MVGFSLCWEQGNPGQNGDVMHLLMSFDFITLFVAVNQMSTCCLGIALSYELRKDVSRNLLALPVVGTSRKLSNFPTK